MPDLWLERRIIGQNGRTPGIWPDSAVLAESRASWPEIGQDGRFQVNWPGSGHFVPDSGNLCRNLYMPSLKKYF
jgi:hypothetical protein